MPPDDWESHELLRFCVFNDKTIKNLGTVEFECETPAFGETYYGYDKSTFKDLSQTITLPVIDFKVDNGDFGRTDEPVSIMFEQTLPARYRHRYVWQYKREHKGVKRQRHAARQAEVRRRIYLPNVEVMPTSDGVTFSAEEVV